MIIQCQGINALLQRRDPSFLSANNLTADFFSDYKKEYDYITEHIARYGNVPDQATFLSAFPNFDVVEVHQKCSNCKMYQYEYTYGNSCRWIYKRTICDDKQHRFYTSLIKILWKLGVITNEYNNIYDKTQKL